VPVQPIECLLQVVSVSPLASGAAVGWRDTASDSNRPHNRHSRWGVSMTALAEDLSGDSHDERVLVGLSGHSFTPWRAAASLSTAVIALKFLSGSSTALVHRTGDLRGRSVCLVRIQAAGSIQRAASRPVRRMWAFKPSGENSTSNRLGE